MRKTLKNILENSDQIEYFELIQSLRDNFNVLLKGKDRTIIKDAYSKLVALADELLKKYEPAECRKTIAYHALIGSTPWKDKEITDFKLDFSGEDNILDALNSLISEYS